MVKGRYITSAGALVYWMASSSGEPCSRVELSISCSNLNLQDNDLFFKSDPVVIVSVKRKGINGVTWFVEVRAFNDMQSQFNNAT